MSNRDLAFFFWICPEALRFADPLEVFDRMPGDLKQRWRAFRESARHSRWQNWADRHSVQFTYPGSPDYPCELAHLEGSPFTLSYVGDPVWLSHRGISILGTRHPSAVAHRWMAEELARFFRRFDGLVFSGAARGVDQKAHLLAVSAGVPTVAVIPLGLMDRYPPSFRELESEILKRGCLISCFPPDWPLYKSNFAERNRLLTSLSQLTLMVEGRAKSGSAMSGKMVREAGRTLAVLPFDPFHVSGGANLQFLKQGAQMVVDAEDLAALWGLTYAAQSQMRL